MKNEVEAEFLKVMYESIDNKLRIKTINFLIENERKYNLFKLIGEYLFNDLFDGDMLLMKIQSVLSQARKDWLNSKAKEK